MTLGENILYYRKKSEITQEQLAEIMQVSRQSVSKWENNEAVPELQKLIKLADVLEVGLDELCGREYVSTGNQIEAKEISAPRRNPAIKIISIVLVVVLFVAGTAAGFSVGKSIATDSKAKEFYHASNVANVDLCRWDGNTMKCTFIPEIYVEEFEYVILLTDEGNKVYEYNVEFENQVGAATLYATPGLNYDVILQVKNGDVVHSIKLVEQLWLNVNGGYSYTLCD